MASITETPFSRRVFKETSISGGNPVSPATFTIASFLRSSEIAALLASHKTRMTPNHVADILKARTLISWKEFQHIKTVYPNFTSQTITQITSIPKTITDNELRQIATNCPKLKHIDLSCAEALTNQGISYLTQLPLEYLNLAACSEITHECFAYFSHMPQLQHLDLSYNMDTWFGVITEEDFAHLRELNLRYLDLGSCSGVTDVCLTELVGKPLEYLAVHGPNITDEGLVSLQGMTRLRRLNLYAYENISEAGLENIKNLPIEELEISGVNFENGLQFLERMPLQKLRFFSCAISQNSFRILQGKQIRSLELEKPTLTLHHEPFVTDEDLFDLKDLPLESLCIKHCDITDQGLFHLRDSQIKNLSVYSCPKLTNQVLIHLQNMPLEQLTIFGSPWMTEQAIETFKQNHPDTTVDIRPPYLTIPPEVARRPILQDWMERSFIYMGTPTNPLILRIIAATASCLVILGFVIAVTHAIIEQPILGIVPLVASLAHRLWERHNR